MKKFKFTAGNIKYIMTQVSSKPVGLKDEALLGRIESLRDPMVQAEQILMLKPFQKYNESVAFVMCQYILENDDSKARPDGTIKKYKKWIDLSNKL